MMKTPPTQNPTFKGIQAIVFQSHGIRFAADMEQIDELLSRDAFENTDKEIIPLHQLISLDQPASSYHDPGVITVQFNGTSLAIMIDQPEDVLFLTRESIHAFPPMVHQLMSGHVIWGVALIDDQPAMLIDFQKLIVLYSGKIPAISPFSGKSADSYTLSAKYQGDPTG